MLKIGDEVLVRIDDPIKNKVNVYHCKITNIDATGLIVNVDGEIKAEVTKFQIYHSLSKIIEDIRFEKNEVINKFNKQISELVNLEIEEEEKDACRV
jgi:ASC-1-like (ASCH) protein